MFALTHTQRPLRARRLLVGLGCIVAVWTACGYYTDRDGDGTFLAPEFEGTALYDCDDTDALLGKGYAFFLDADGDLLGDASTVCYVCLGINPSLYGQAEQESPTGCTGTYVYNALDCRDSGDNAANFGEGVWMYQDADQDGFGDPSLTLATYVCPDEVELTEDRGYVRNPLDCNDSLDDSLPPSQSFYWDGDGDGVGGAQRLSVCSDAASLPTGYALESGDCDDARPDTYPGAPDCSVGTLADHDESCDGRADEDDFRLWYKDADQDGWGTLVTNTSACRSSANGDPVCLTSCPVGQSIALYVRETGDCDDENPNLYPGSGC